MYDNLPRSLIAGKKRRHARRGISVIVGTLLLVAVVVTLGVLVYAFASYGLGSFSQSFTNLMAGSADTISENDVVEQVVFFFSGTTGADIYVRNVGAISSTLVSVYIVDQSTGTFISQIAISTAVNVGSVVNVPHTTITFAPSHGHTYSFTVTSSLGNSVIYNAKAT